MNLNEGKRVNSLVHEYELTTGLEATNEIANKQVSIVRSLCEIGTKEAMLQVERMMIEGKSHEYMNFAFSDILRRYIETTKNSESKVYLIQTLIAGALRGRGETLQKACLNNLLDIQYIPIYQALIEYRNYLLDNNSCIQGQFRFQVRKDLTLSSINEVLVAIHPYVDEHIRVPLERLKQLLRLNEPIHLRV